MTLLDDLRAEALENDKRLGRERVKVDSIAAEFDGERIVQSDRLIVDESRYHSAYDIPKPKAERKRGDLDHEIRYVDASVWPATIGELSRVYLGHVARDSIGRRRKPTIINEAPDYGSMRFLRPSSGAGGTGTPPVHYFDDSHRDGELGVVDIRSAYWSLLRAWPLDVWFRPGFDRMSIIEGTMAWWHPDEVDKDLGRAIYGTIRSHELREYHRGTRHVFEGRNRFLAPDAVGLMLWTMHAICAEGIDRFGCVHFSTDSLIVDAADVDDVRDWLHDEWGLHSAVKAQGRGHIWAFNHWRVGAHTAYERLPHVDRPGWSTRLDLRSIDVRRLKLARARSPLRAYV